MKITPELMVRDIATSLDFYHQILGFEIEVIFPESKPIFARIKYLEARIMLYQEEAFRQEYPNLNQPINSTSAIFIEVDHIQAWVEKIADLPVISSLHNTDYGTSEFAIADPDNYLLIFSEGQN
jgi:lactoylglutathione lyase